MKYKIIQAMCFIIGCTVFRCYNNEELEEEKGVSHIYFINDTSQKLRIVTFKIITDSVIVKNVGSGETTFVCSDETTGGWLKPSKILKLTEIGEYDQYGNLLGFINNRCENDSFWDCSDKSTWRESFWYYTVK